MSDKRPRAPTAYFLFCDQHRAEVQQQLNSQQTGGSKVPVSAIAKALGQKWGQLTEEGKLKYKEQAAARAAKLAADAQAQGGAGHAEAEATTAAGSSKAAAAAGFPQAVLKRVMHADPDVTRASADAVWLVGKAVEMFVVEVADKCHKAAKARKQTTAKLQDFTSAVRSDRRLCRAGLKDIAAGVQRSAEAAALTAAAAAAGAQPRRPTSKPAAAEAAAAEAPGHVGAVEGHEGAADDAEAAAAGPGDGSAEDDGAAGRDQPAKRPRVAAQDADGGSKAKGQQHAKNGSTAAAAAATHKITTFFVKRPGAAVDG